MEPLQVTAPETELLMIGSCSCTYRLGRVVIKVPRIDEDAEITQENAKATKIEANVYQILGTHDRIANCLYISPTKNMITLEFYGHGNLKDYVAIHGPTQLLIWKWAKQMIEAVQFIHGKGVRHSDIRLDQWLLDSGMNARLSDFNSAGYDECPAFGLHGEKAFGDEDPSHFMPRDSSEDNSVRSDLFALGSALYEIEHGSTPFADVDDETIAQRFTRREFPSVSHLTLGCIISGSWEGKFSSAVEMLQVMETQGTLLSEELPDTLTSVNKLALTYRDQGRWKEAEELFVKVVEARRTVLGKEHPKTLTSATNLAITLREREKTQEAQDLLKMCAESRDRVLKRDHSHSEDSIS